MAKLHSYFVLCPLLDRKSFLGITRGKEEGDVIVTLGRNVVNKYRLSDQKQIGGWTSKDHITSAVVYDNEHDEYVGVFNNNSLKMWKEEYENLEKVKKLKFSAPIFKVIKYGNSSLVVFTNGTCASLQYAIDNRKVAEEKPLLKSGDTIVDVATYKIQETDYVCYIIQNNRGALEILSCALQADLGDLMRSKLQRYKITRDEADINVLGKMITVVETPTVYVLWSDAKVYSFDLTKCRWKLCGTVPWISAKSNFSMEWMGDQHLILFGSDTEQDGAILIAFNVALGVGSCRYPMKIYCERAKLYCFNKRIILEAGNHLGMLPYALETSRSLSSLIGTHEIHHDDYTELVDWGVGEIPDCDAEGTFKELLKKGMTEQSIVHHVLPPLMSAGDPSQILHVVKQFNDVPESIIVKLLQYAVKLFNHDECVLQDEGLFKEMYDKHIEQNNFLSYVFSLPFSDAIIIPHLRSILSLKEALFLLTYLGHLIEGDSDFGLDYERKIVDWCALFMDAFYQQYLITSDKAVTNTLDYTNTVIAKLIKSLEELSNLIPLLHGVLNRHKETTETVETPLYSIEVMHI